MAALPNCTAWYSCDRDTGVPTGVRLAWLSVAENDAPPTGVDLVFRIRELRQNPVPPTARRCARPRTGFGARAG